MHVEEEIKVNEVRQPEEELGPQPLANTEINNQLRSSNQEAFASNNPMQPQAGASFLPPIDFGKQKLSP